MAEFALVAPLFFLLLLAVIEGARFIYHYEVLNNATREGVRYAIIHGSQGSPPTGPPDEPDGAAIKQAVSDATFGLVGAGQLTFPDPNYSLFPNGGTNERGSTVTVAVTFTYPTFIPVLPPITISAESSGVVNN